MNVNAKRKHNFVYSEWVYNQDRGNSHLQIIFTVNACIAKVGKTYIIQIACIAKEGKTYIIEIACIAK